ncbi:MAG: hypothetical protein GQ527_06955 [Bacteroidales bacterium]|nr:hypothetical protein [Bacteroidales bacterium]
MKTFIYFSFLTIVIAFIYTPIYAVNIIETEISGNNYIQNVDSSKIDQQLLFFSNNGCGKCSVAQQFFDQYQMPYEKYTIKEHRPLMYEYIHKKTGGKNIGIGYPVLVYGDSIYFSIKKINTVLEEIKQMMEKDGIIENNQTIK